MAASHYKANHLVAIVDHNKYQQTGPVSREMALSPFASKWISFGWNVQEVDGHDIQTLIAALQSAQAGSEKPSVIIAHTIKGKGVSFVEGDYTFHGRPLTQEQAEKARQEILCH
jgi:transketolase